MSGYTQKFRKPSCFGKRYDPEEEECTQQCPFREDCYDQMFINEAKRTPSRSKWSGKGRSTPTQMSRVQDQRGSLHVYDDNEVLPYPDEAWYSRLWWNSLSGAFSAMGFETHVFFRKFRFPPKPKKEVVDVRCCAHKAEDGEDN